MVLYWWTCPWCMDRMATRHSEDEVRADQQAHLTQHHSSIVHASARLLAISHYRFTEVPQ